MKRFLIRMSTLATIVVLGLIAIAQAQRGVGDQPSEADASKGVAASTPPDKSETSRDEPGLFPGTSETNPLRRDPTAPIARALIPASTGSGERYARLAQATETVDPGEPADGRSRDPFAAIAAVASGGPSSNDQSVPLETPEPPGATAEVPGGTSPAYRRPEGGVMAPSRYPALASPTESDVAPGAPTMPVLAAPNSGGPSIDDRYARPAEPPADTREPARIEIDPKDPVSSLPPLGGLAAADSGQAELGSVRGGIGGRVEGTGTPGSKQLEGPQTPQLTIQKFAPEEIQVGKEAVFQVKVINSGPIVAHGVEVRDEIPKGTRLIGSDPQASRGADGELVWSLGSLQPGDETSVEVRLMPEAEGSIGSVASVRFNAEASARTVATKPELVIQTSAPNQVLIGEEAKLTITISNPGSGTAYGVVLEEHVPPGMQHEAGEELEYAVGDLAPNDSRQLELTLAADSAGVTTNVLLARADANLKVEDRVDIEIIAPELDVALAGPKKRFLEREATYTLSVSNPGTAPARNVELVAYLPEGLEFVSANNSGQYQPANRTVHWSLEELPVRETGMVRLTTLPVEAGEQTLRFSSSAEPGLTVEKKQPIVVEGIAAIVFQVVDVDDPIELGGETTYEIRVVNQGSKAATNVQLVATLPPEMRAVAAEGPARHSIEANRVIFEGLSRLAPKADTTYRVRVQGLQPGDLRLSVQLLTDEMTTPVIKQESTQVYSDE